MRKEKGGGGGGGRGGEGGESEGVVRITSFSHSVQDPNEVLGEL